MDINPFMDINPGSRKSCMKTGIINKLYPNSSVYQWFVLCTAVPDPIVLIKHVASGVHKSALNLRNVIAWGA